MHFKLNLKIQSGRSMTEMLGVIAIIGILSIGAILGYKIATYKYKAYATLDELEMRAMENSQKLMQGATNLDSSELGDKTRLGYPVFAHISPKFGNYFEISLENVESGVCRELLKTRWQVPYSIYVELDAYEGDESICNQKEEVKLIYEFEKDLTPKSGVPDDEKHDFDRCNTSNDCKCGDCEEGICESYCPENAGCVKSFDDPRWFVCCKNENIVANMCCSSVEDNKCCTFGGQCCPVDKPLRDKNGYCHSCDENSQINVEGVIENCSVCSNRMIFNKNYCALQHCPDNHFKNQNGECVPCDYPIKGNDSKNLALPEECAKCPNRTLNGYGVCHPKCDSVENGTQGKPVPEVWGQCRSCDEDGAFWMYVVSDYPKCTSVCKNRVMDRKGGGGYCRKACTDAANPLLSMDGKCYPCSYEGHINTIGLTDTCENLCSNRKTQGDYCVLSGCPEHYFKNQNGECMPCDYPVKNHDDKNLASPEECNKCPNRTRNNYGVCHLKCDSVENGTQGKPVAEVWGQCRGCDEDGAFWMYLVSDYPKCTSVCKNRVMDRKGEGGYCRKACTDAAYPLLSTDGKCYPCNYEGRIYTGALTDTCENLCPERQTVGDFCVPKNCPDNYFKNNNNECVSCDYSAKDHDSKNLASMEECAKCSNRTRNNYGVCHLICDSAQNETQDKPLPNVWGECHGCDETADIWMYVVSDYPKCASICPNREMDRTAGGGYCVKRACSALHLLEDKDGNCYACNISTPIDVGGDKAKCDACLNRTMQDEYCVMK